MNSGFVNRLVGTLIVVAAAIIFIPIILDGEKAPSNQGFGDIPPRSDYEAINLDADFPEQAFNEAMPVKTAESEEEQSIDQAWEAAQKIEQTTEGQAEGSSKADEIVNQPISVAESIPRPESSNLTEYAYVIQLGSFSHKPNVDALLAKLKQGGFTAFTQPIQTKAGLLTKVFVGPELDKTALEKKLPALNKLTRLNGKVTPFEVTK